MSGDRRDTAEGSERLHSPDPGVDGADQKRHPLIPVEWGPIVAAAITGGISLLVYTFGMMQHIDARLDELEKEARVLLEGDGSVRPSREAIEALIKVEALKQRLQRLEAADG